MGEPECIVYASNEKSFSTTSKMKIIIVISCYRAPGPDSGSLVYVKPYCRIAPYLVGMVLGYLLNHSKDWRLPTKVTENKIITSLWCVFIVSRKF